MKRRRITKNAWLITAIGLVICGGLVLAIALWPRATPTSHSSDDTSKNHPAEVPLGLKTTILTSQAKLNAYKAGLDPRIVKKDYIHQVPTIDWQTQNLLAIEYSLYVARSVQGVQVNEGHPDKISLDVKDPTQGCVSPQINEQNISFVAIEKTVTDVSVTINRIANNQKCLTK